MAFALELQHWLSLKSPLLAHPADSGFANLHNSVSQFLRLNPFLHIYSLSLISIYMQKPDTQDD